MCYYVSASARKYDIKSDSKAVVCNGFPFSIAAQPISVVSVLVDEEALARPHDVELIGNLTRLTLQRIG